MPGHSPLSRPTERAFACLFGLLACVFLLSLIARGYIGLFSYYLADDYCIANEARLGVWAAQSHWYMNWSGTVSSNLLANLAGPEYLSAARAWPVAALITWTTLLSWTVWQLRLSVGCRWRLLTSVVLAAMTLVLTLDGRPQMTPQVLYWLSGSTKYLAPQLFLVGYVGFIVYCCRRTRRPEWRQVTYIGAGVLAAIAGLFAEVHMAAQVTGLVVAALACVLLARQDLRRRLMPLMGAGVGGSLFAFLIIALAPGMQVRQGLHPEPPDLFTLSVATVGYTLEFFREVVTRAPENVLLAILVPVLVAWVSHERERDSECSDTVMGRGLLPWLVVIPLWTVIVVAACFAVTAWAASTSGPVRALLPPQFLLFSALVTWGYLVGWWIRAHVSLGGMIQLKVPALIVLALVPVWPLSESWDILGSRFEAEANSRTWEAFDRRLREAKKGGESAVYLPAPENESGIDVVGPDANFWVNSCVSAFYGVSVTGHAPPPLPNVDELHGMNSVEVDVGDVATITDYAVSRVFVAPGETFPLSVRWLPRSVTDVPHRVSVDLYGPNGQLITQQTFPLLDGTYSTVEWAPGRPFLDTYLVEIPERVEPASDARLVVSLYEESSFRRLPVVARGDAPGSVLGSVWISELGCGPRTDGRDAIGRTLDTHIGAAVAGLFADDPVLGSLQIEVAVYESAVHLCSPDTSKSERERAVALVWQVGDVAGVIDHMK